MCMFRMGQQHGDRVLEYSSAVARSLKLNRTQSRSFVAAAAVIIKGFYSPQSIKFFEIPEKMESKLLL